MQKVIFREAFDIIIYNKGDYYLNPRVFFIGLGCLPSWNANMFEASKDEVILKFDRLRFLIPKRYETFWPYYGIFFAGEYRELLDNIRASDVVLDAGANVGFFTLPASLKAKLVIAVEPSLENFRLLARNVKLNRRDNVILVNKALSDYTGIGYLAERGPLSSSLDTYGVEVSVTTIDDLLDELGLDCVNVIKMDIEGSEGKALRGDFLKHVRKIVVEVHGRDNEEIVTRILKEKGFNLSYWRFSASYTLARIIKNIVNVIDAEFKIGFPLIRLILAFLVSGKHPVQPADKHSDVKLIYAWKD